MDPDLLDWVNDQLRVVKVTAFRDRPWARIWRIERFIWRFYECMSHLNLSNHGPPVPISPSRNAPQTETGHGSTGTDPGPPVPLPSPANGIKPLLCWEI